MPASQPAPASAYSAAAAPKQLSFLSFCRKTPSPTTPGCRWGYALATREELLEAWAYPLVRLPGLLLASKLLGPGATSSEGKTAAALALPRRLVVNEDACDLAQMVKGEKGAGWEQVADGQLPLEVPSQRAISPILCHAFQSSGTFSQHPIQPTLKEWESASLP